MIFLSSCFWNGGQIEYNLRVQYEGPGVTAVRARAVDEVDFRTPKLYYADHDGSTDDWCEWCAPGLLRLLVVPKPKPEGAF